MAYLALADFLPGVGRDGIQRIPKNRKPSEDPAELAASAKELARKLPWLHQSASEAQQLMRELRDCGFFAE